MTPTAEAIQAAFDALGGVDALVEWVNGGADAKKAFYTQIWLKILPLQPSGAGDDDHRVTAIIRTIYDPQHQDGQDL